MTHLGPVGDPLPPEPPTGLVLYRARSGRGSNPAQAREVISFEQL